MPSFKDLLEGKIVSVFYRWSALSDARQDFHGQKKVDDIVRIVLIASTVSRSGLREMLRVQLCTDPLFYTRFRTPIAVRDDGNIYSLHGHSRIGTHVTCFNLNWSANRRCL